MKRLPILIAVLAMALAAPELTSRAHAQASAQPPAARVPVQRATPPRQLLSPAERAALRAEWLQATPEQRRAIWLNEIQILQARAAVRNEALVLPTMRRDDSFAPSVENRGRGQGAPVSWGARAP